MSGTRPEMPWSYVRNRPDKALATAAVCKPLRSKRNPSPWHGEKLARENGREIERRRVSHHGRQWRGGPIRRLRPPVALRHGHARRQAHRPRQGRKISPPILFLSVHDDLIWDNGTPFPEPCIDRIAPTVGKVRSSS
ncbi:hypothetical protein BHE74_00030401 [Ensete ventricosum]|nr:hypothetical protein BHE74_00030401 [Ensete ventricosum]RZS07900.1 hypothetical protein BHM03_00038814 [Ensete ventricosum]